MKAHLRPCLVLFTLLTLLTGVAYPALITVIAQVVFHDQANGSVIHAGWQGGRLGSDRSDV